VPPAGRELPGEPTANEQNQLVTLYQAGRYAELENQSNLLLKRYPDSGFGWKILSAALSMQGKDALHALQQTAARLPRDAEILNNLGDALARRELLKEAEECFRKAIQIKPGFADALFNLGATLMPMGMLQEAATYFHKTLAINPGSTDARYFLTQLGKVKRDSQDFKDLIEFERIAHSTNAPLTGSQSMYLNFALGKSYDDIGDADRAFRHFAEGNRLKRQTFQYDKHADTRIFTEIMRIFDKPAIQRLRGAGDPSRVPVFIVGMPRSGTTLVEQILASHPDVHGAGELTDMPTIMQRNIAGSEFPENLRLLDGTRLAAWGKEYVASLRKRSPSALRISDKLPINFMAIGLIHVMLPNAKIIHVRRDPLDTCLSCFNNLFTQDNVKWSYDLTELGTYYANYARLMEHWRDVLPSSAMLEIDYEELVKDCELQTRRLIDYCELEWNENCLEFHSNKRAVRTVSLAQVRKPVYNSSIERWRSYEKHLGPLLAVLGDMAPGQ